jgi:hypothetical protein
MKKLQLYPEFAADYYVMNEGSLYRKLANGELFKVTTSDRSRLVTTFCGEVYKALDIAYLLYYGYFPKRKTLALDGDQYNLSLDNVVAARTKRYRFSPMNLPQGITHNLNKLMFPNHTACYNDWLLIVTHRYRTEMRLILAEDAREIEIVKANAGSRPKPSFFPTCYEDKLVKRVEKPPKPSKKHVWSGRDWVLVPSAINVADDYKVRACRIMEGCSVFEYDSALQQVVAKG